MDETNADLLRRGYEAIERRDLASLTDLIAEDARWHVAGDSVIAGTHEGRDAIFGIFVKILQSTGGTMVHEVLNVFADDETGVVVYRQKAEARAFPTIRSTSRDSGSPEGRSSKRGSIPSIRSVLTR